jgi:ribosome biogenesis GTPase / thiamine phosphate phosphatase
LSKTYRNEQQTGGDSLEGELAELVEGLIVDGSRGMYRVETEVGSFTCTIRGRLRKVLDYTEGGQAGRGGKSARKVTVKPHDPVAVGDRVRLLPTGHGAGVIEEVVARSGGAFTRRDPDPKQGDLTTVAGLDQMAIVFAARNPEPHLGMLDRFLAVAEAQGIAPLIVISKVDLGVAEGLATRLALYERLGYPVLRTSVATGEGIAALRTGLAGRTTALLGTSGVGKSSLLNALEPGIAQRVDEVNGATGKGRHTTTATRLFPLSGPAGGYLADTAGIRALGLSRDTERRLDECFPEFRQYLGACRMRACGHIVEPDCAVRAAVQAGVVDRQRYESYCRMRGADGALLDDPDEEEADAEPLAYLAGEWANGERRRA